jgi:hypothetical protein
VKILLRIATGNPHLRPFQRRWFEVFTPARKKTQPMVESFFLVAGGGLGHLWRPRKNIFENKFSRVYSRPNCHWQFSPPTFLVSKIRELQDQRKSPSLAGTFSLVAGGGLLRYIRYGARNTFLRAIACYLNLRLSPAKAVESENRVLSLIIEDMKSKTLHMGGFWNSSW